MVRIQIQGGFGPIKPTKPDSEIRRHPGNILKDHEWQPKTMSDEYEACLFLKLCSSLHLTNFDDLVR